MLFMFYEIRSIMPKKGIDPIESYLIFVALRLGLQLGGGGLGGVLGGHLPQHHAPPLNLELT